MGVWKQRVGSQAKVGARSKGSWPARRRAKGLGFRVPDSRARGLLKAVVYVRGSALRLAYINYIK